MTSQYLQELTAVSSILSSYVIPITDDPSGTSRLKKCTFTQITDFIEGDIDRVGKVEITQPATYSSLTIQEGCSLTVSNDCELNQNLKTNNTPTFPSVILGVANEGRILFGGTSNTVTSSPFLEYDTVNQSVRSYYYSSVGSLGGIELYAGTEFSTIDMSSGYNLYVTGESSINQNVTTSGGPSFSSTTSPVIIGGTGTTSTLTLKTTTGVGTTNADMIFLVGNNGATEALRILNSGYIGINRIDPTYRLDLKTETSQTNYFRITGNNVGDTDGFFRITNYTSTSGIFAPIFWSKSSDVAYPGMSFISDVGTDTGTIPIIRLQARQNNTTVSTRPLFSIENYTGTAKLIVLASGKIGIGTVSPSVLLELISTTEQLRVGYDSSNYFSTNVSSSGVVTFNAVGASQSFVFSDPVTITSGSVTGITDIIVADGGTGRSSSTAYAVVCGGTTSTGPLQSVASVGTAGQVLTSNGAGALPTFQDAGGGVSYGKIVATIKGLVIG